MASPFVRSLFGSGVVMYEDAHLEADYEDRQLVDYVDYDDLCEFCSYTLPMCDCDPTIGDKE